MKRRDEVTRSIGGKIDVEYSASFVSGEGSKGYLWVVIFFLVLGYF